MKIPVIQLACSTCSLHSLCMPVGLTDEDMVRIDSLVSIRRHVKKGSTLFHNGEAFAALYAICSGFFKTALRTKEGVEQVTGFQMAGEMMGLDGIYSNQHTCDAIALEDSEVCVIPFEHLEDVARELASLQHHVHQVLGKEIVREHNVMLLLGSLRAETKLASFLLNLLQRLHARGFSDKELVLRMTRQDIGSYLGLTLETVSRLFSKLDATGIVQVHNRRLRILKSDALQAMATH